MGKKPELHGLEAIIGTEEDVYLTDREYFERTGAALPKGNSYLLNRSALATWLLGKGYEIVSVEEQPVIERTIHIKRRR